jgi:hypothetical protein
VKGSSPLVANASTDAIVGPGTYIPKAVPKTSAITNEPEFSFPKEERFGLFNKPHDMN